MKRVFILLILLFAVSGCSLLDDSVVVESKDIKGYWVQLERDISGKVEDMRKDPYAYLEITDNKLFFYTESDTDKGYYDSVAEKNYILEDNKIYYDYYELKGDNWKKKISEFGGIFVVTFDEKNLILTENYGSSVIDGYQKNTYKRVKDENRLLKP
jgi:hypothetical protein